MRGRVASYAWGDDYHNVLAPRLKTLVHFIEHSLGHRVASRWYTDTGPILERDLAQRAGLGWIGRNTCLINPRAGSYLLLSEILLGIELEPDEPFRTDHCGSCTRCIDACPTSCILPDRTLDARRCISYLTIELRSAVPASLRPLIGDWVFGCDICQSVCPWNRFAPEDVDPSFLGTGENPHPVLTEEVHRSREEFAVRASGSPLRRIGPVGYRRNTAIALGNVGSTEEVPALQLALADPEPMIREHASWAIHRIAERLLENPADRDQQPWQD